ncbi:MAG: NAD(P)H-hydrate dehydratase [Clostridia bacterium]|nr:NAD(P)H-hydrate dehydratase [Clostridia bacterium]
MIEPILVTKELVKECFPKRDNNANKGTFGHAVIIGGSAKYVGAPQFSSSASLAIISALGKAAMRVGAGTSQLCIPDTLSPYLYQSTLYSSIYSLKSEDGNIACDEAQINEIMSRATAFAIGMGMDKGDAESIVLQILENGEQNIVIDADGLASTSGIRNFKNRCILTPHAKEFSKFTNTPIETVKKYSLLLGSKYAKEKGCILLLKGTPTTVITDGENDYINNNGNVSLAKGGSGDVLSGIICGLLAWGLQPIKAAYCGAYILGRCAELNKVNEYSTLPEDIVAQIPNVLDEVLK